MNITVMAETSPKDSYQENGLVFYKQYAVGSELTDAERDHFYKAFRMDEMYRHVSPVITMRRRVDSRGGVLSFWEWDYFDCFESIEKAASGFGDSDYWKLDNSRHELHRKNVSYNRDR